MLGNECNRANLLFTVSAAGERKRVRVVGTKAASSGVVVSTYRPSGSLRTGSFDDAA